MVPAHQRSEMMASPAPINITEQKMEGGIREMMGDALSGFFLVTKSMEIHFYGA